MKEILLSWSWSHQLLFYLAESSYPWLEYWIGSGYFEDFDVFCLAGDDDFLSAVLYVDVVGSWSYHSCDVVVGLSEFGFHAAEGDVCFGYFILVVDLKVVGGCMVDEIPGPTWGLGLPWGAGLSLLNTNAIKFIIMDYLIQLTKRLTFGEKNSEKKKEESILFVTLHK